MNSYPTNATSEREPQPTPRILVIDDQADTRATIAMILRVKGFEAVTAESAAAGLREFGGTTFDLVIAEFS